MNDGIDVVIPARNESETLPDVAVRFANHPAIRRVWIGLDADDTEGAGNIELVGGADPDYLGIDIIPFHYPPISGKGQIVTQLLRWVETSYIIFCDADVTGLTADHIDMLIADAIFDEDGKNPVMTIGVPDVPANYPKNRLWAWPWVSGQRCVPTALVRPLMLHGYLMETQINLAARHAGMSVRFEWLKGLKSEYNMSVRRLGELYRDGAYGRRTGILLEASEYVDEKRGDNA